MDQIIDFLLHTDRHLGELICEYGGYIYAILFLIIFAETGLVVAPFLPGDGLLFAAGVAAASAVGQCPDAQPLNVGILVLVLTLAAIIGNTTNYFIGRQIGRRLMHAEKPWLVKRKHLVATRAFFFKYGRISIVISRFLPLFRTFVPFVAGTINMSWHKFTTYNILGAILWVPTFLLLGYGLGNIPIVKSNLSSIVLALIIITIIPAIITMVKNYYSHKNKEQKRAKK